MVWQISLIIILDSWERKQEEEELQRENNFGLFRFSGFVMKVNISEN